MDESEDIKPALAPSPLASPPASPPLREVSPHEVAITLTPNASAGTRPANSSRPANPSKNGKTGKTGKTAPAAPGRFPPRNEDDERQCTNCGEVDTPQWRGTLCNACALWKRARGSDRPLPLRFPVRKRARSVTPELVEVDAEMDGEEDDLEGRDDENAPKVGVDDDGRSQSGPMWRRGFPSVANTPPGQFMSPRHPCRQCDSASRSNGGRSPMDRICNHARAASPDNQHTERGGSPHTRPVSRGSPYPRPLFRQTSHPDMRPSMVRSSLRPAPRTRPSPDRRPASTPTSARRDRPQTRQRSHTPASPLPDDERLPPHMAILARAAQMISSMEDPGDLTHTGAPDPAQVNIGRKRAAAVSGDVEATYIVSPGPSVRNVESLREDGKDRGAEYVGRTMDGRYALSPSPPAVHPPEIPRSQGRVGAREVSITPSASRLGRRLSTLAGLGGIPPTRSLAPLPTREEFMRSAEWIYGLLERTEVAIETLAALSGGHDLVPAVGGSGDGMAGEAGEYE